MLHVFLLQVVDYLVGALWILLVKIVRDLNERVVVPLIADNTMKVGSPDSVTKEATPFMRSGEPTEVPPNFITFIVVILFNYFT